MINFWNRLQAFDIENIDAIFNSDFELTETFANELVEWCENKLII